MRRPTWKSGASKAASRENRRSAGRRSPARPRPSRRCPRLGSCLHLQVAQHGAAGAQDVHGVGRGRDQLQHGAQGHGQPAHPLEPRTVGLERGPVGESLMDEQVRHLLERPLRGHLVDVVAPVVQVVAERPTVQIAVVPAATPESATDFFALGPCPEGGGIVGVAAGAIGVKARKTPRQAVCSLRTRTGPRGSASGPPPHAGCRPAGSPCRPPARQRPPRGLRSADRARSQPRRSASHRA